MKLSQLKKIMNNLPAGADPSNAAWRNEFLRSQGLEPEEMYQELEMDNCMVDTHQDISYARGQVDLHSHNFMEIIYCRSNCSVEYLVGAERFRMGRGDVVIIPPGCSHRPLLPEKMPVPYVRDVLWISPKFTELLFRTSPALAKSVHIGSALLHTDEETGRILGELFEKGVRYAESNEEDAHLAVVGNTITLLVQLHRACQHRTARPKPAEKPQLLDRVLAYVEENLANRITLAETARHFFVSESTITQQFRKKLGVSFYHCVTQRRLIAAKSLIEQNVQLEQVGERVGFADYSAFYRAFKKEYGISPVQYRKLQSSNNRS